MATVSLGPDVNTTRKNRMGYWRDHQGKSLLVTPLVSEEMAAAAFLRFKQEGLLPIIFSEWDVNLSWFLNHYIKENISMLACISEDPKTKKMEPCGLSWIVNKLPVGPYKFPVFYKAEVGIGFFRHVSPGETLEFGRMTTSWAFENMDILSLYACTPEPNVAVARYTKRIGYNVTGPLGNFTTWVNKDGIREPCGCYISHLTKAEWENKNWR